MRFLRHVPNRLGPVLAVLFVGGAVLPLRAADVVDRIVGAVPGLAPAERLADVQRLPAELPPERIRVLLEFLASPEDPAPAEQAAVIRNDLVPRLLDAGAGPERVAAALLRAWRDEKQSPMWRNYCLQFLGGMLPALPETEAERVRAALKAALSSDGIGQAGTAMLALLDRGVEGEEARQLADRAAAIVADPAQRDGARVSAFHVVVELQDPRAAELARAVLAESRSVPLRLVALHSLGRFGNPEDLALIERYLDNPIPVIRIAARAAQENFAKAKEIRR